VNRKREAKSSMLEKHIALKYARQDDVQELDVMAKAKLLET
jgi:hypothetical protein